MDQSRTPVPLATRTAAWRSALLPALVLLAGVAVGCTNKNEKVFPIVGGFPPPYTPAFGTARTIDPAPASSSSVVAHDPARGVAFDASGAGLVLLKADDGTGVTRLYAVRYDPSAGALASPFSAPILVDANTGGSVDQARVCLAPGGNGLILFSQYYQGSRRAYARTYTRSTGTFGAPGTIDSGGSNSLPEDVFTLDAAMAATGDAVIAFGEADDVFGVRFTASTGAFSSPQQLDGISGAGVTCSALRVLERSGAGVITWLQDADSSATTRRVLAVSRHSTSGSLSFAVTANPDTSTDVPDYAVRVASNGTTVLAFTQVQSGGGTRVFGRAMQASGSFATAADLGGAVADTFAEPVVATDGAGNALVTLRRVPLSGTAGLYANRWTGAQGTFASNPTRVDDSAAGAVVSGSAWVAADGQGRAEIAFVQEQASATGSHGRVLAVRYEPATGYGAARAVDHGPAQTGALVTTPMGYAAPAVTGLGFDPNGRAFCSYTQSDGHLRRLYVAASPAGQPGTFAAPTPADAALRNSLFATAAVTSEVEPGGGAFALAPDGTSGLALTRQREINGSTNIVRLYATPWSGYQASALRLVGARLLDDFRDDAGARDVGATATALDASGAGLTVFTQSDGTSVELLAETVDATGRTSAPGGSAATADNGTTNAPSAPRVLLDGPSGNGWVCFLQDDGSGRVQLYARRYLRASGALSPVGPTSPTSANDPIALTGASAGAVQSYDAVLHASDGAAYIVFRQVKNSGSGAEGVFAVKCRVDGSVVGPTEFSDTTATIVGDPRIHLDGGGNALTVFVQGAPPILCSRHSTSSSLGMSVSGLPPVISASTTAACGAFAVAADGSNNFLVAFERDDSGASPAKAIYARRWLASTAQWEGTDAVKISSGTATTASPALAYAAPQVAMTAGGRAVILFRQDDDRPLLDTVNLQAVAYDPAQPTPFASPVTVDNGDGSVSHGLDVVAGAYLAAVRGTDGEGAIFFVQDADPTASSRPRLYALRIHLANIGTGAAVFDGTAADLSEGGGATTAVTGVTAAFAPTGAGWVAFTEQAGTDADNLRTHLFARSYHLGSGAFGANLTMSRALNVGDASAGSGAEGEHASNPEVALAPAGGVRVTFLLRQDADGSTPATLDRARAFANAVR